MFSWLIVQQTENFYYCGLEGGSRPLTLVARPWYTEYYSVLCSKPTCRTWAFWPADALIIDAGDSRAHDPGQAGQAGQDWQAGTWESEATLMPLSSAKLPQDNWAKVGIQESGCNFILSCNTRPIPVTNQRPDPGAKFQRPRHYITENVNLCPWTYHLLPSHWLLWLFSSNDHYLLRTYIHA